MRTTSGKLSWTMTLNGAFLALWCIVFIANAFGFAAYEPPAEAPIIMLAVVTIINMALRYWRTREPIQRGGWGGSDRTRMNAEKR